MELIHEPFDFNGQLKNVDNILAVPVDKVQRFNHIPKSEEMGDLPLFIALCSVVHICVRLKRIVPYNEFGQADKNIMAKEMTFRQRVIVQQSFINIMREHSKCFDFIFSGDEMTCILDTTFQNDINELFEQLAKLNSIMSVISKTSQRFGLFAMEWGMGVHYGEAFVSVQHYHLDDVDFNWSGTSWHIARSLSGKAIDNAPNNLYVSDVFYHNLKDQYKDLMRKVNENTYTANIINKLIKDWQTENLDK